MLKFQTKIAIYNWEQRILFWGNKAERYAALLKLYKQGVTYLIIREIRKKKKKTK